MNTWGGRRANAGRKSVLTAHERLLIGGACEKRWREEYIEYGWLDAIITDAIQEELRPLGPRPDWIDPEEDEAYARKKLKKHPAIRAEKLLSQAKRVKPKNRAAWCQNTLPKNRKVLAELLKELKGKKEPKAATRPYGVKRTIVNDIATWATARFEKHITERMVVTCWVRYRKFNHSDSPE